jgi:hypothetical protein
MPIRIVWRYQRDNQKQSIEEGHTIQWPKEKVQKDKHDLQNITQEAKDRATQASLRPEVKPGAPEG